MRCCVHFCIIYIPLGHPLLLTLQTIICITSPPLALPYPFYQNLVFEGSSSLAFALASLSLSCSSISSLLSSIRFTYSGVASVPAAPALWPGTMNRRCASAALVKFCLQLELFAFSSMAASRASRGVTSVDEEAADRSLDGFARGSSLSRISMNATSAAIWKDKYQHIFGIGKLLVDISIKVGELTKRGNGSCDERCSRRLRVVFREMSQLSYVVLVHLAVSCSLFVPCSPSTAVEEEEFRTLRPRRTVYAFMLHRSNRQSVLIGTSPGHFDFVCCARLP